MFVKLSGSLDTSKNKEYKYLTGYNYVSYSTFSIDNPRVSNDFKTETELLNAKDSLFLNTPYSDDNISENNWIVSLIMVFIYLEKSNVNTNTTAEI